MTGATQANTRATQFDLANRGKVGCGSVLGDEFLPIFLRNLVIRHLHISHNAPNLFPPPPHPPILHNLCFSFLVGITAVPREIENHAYAKFRGANKVHYGKCGSGV